jgi:glycerol-3-phosphate acyltransferase PlsY
VTSPIRLLAAAAAGYALGMLPSADLAARLAGRADVDLHHDGTGNPGGLNASHMLGRRWGAAVSAADMGKGYMAGRLGARLAGDSGAQVASSAAVLGHCHPIGRDGGKGVAASLGQVAATFPVYLPIDVCVGVATSSVPWFRHRTQTATAVASSTWVGCAVLWWRRRLPNPGGVEPRPALAAGAAFSSLVIAARFRAEADKVDAYNEQVAA